MPGAYEPAGPARPPVRRHDAPDATVDAAVRALRDGRRDPTRVVLEGVHALKHAVRFGAEIEVVVTPDLDRLTRLLDELAPDVPVPAGTVELTDDRWRDLVPRGLPSPALSLCRRPEVDVDEVLARRGRVVVLEQPRHLGNLGAAVRVAAAADAAGVLVVGDVDPWHPTAVRAAAGLHLALPVGTVDVDTLVAARDAGPLVALDPEGDEMTAGLPADAVLLVGTERGGLSAELRGAADLRVRLPMRRGVSSLNLATAVAAALYTGVPGPAPRR